MLPMVDWHVQSCRSSPDQLITRTGKYKIYPIIGSAILLVACLLLSTLKYDTPYWTVAIFALLFGIGLGLAMMTIVTPIQNSVEPRDMGVAIQRHHVREITCWRNWRGTFRCDHDHPVGALSAIGSRSGDRSGCSECDQYERHHRDS